KGSLSIEGGVVEVRAGGRTRGRFDVADVVSGGGGPVPSPEARAGEAVGLVTRGGVEGRGALGAPGGGAGLLPAAGGAPEQRAVGIDVRSRAAGAERSLQTFGAILGALTSTALLAATVYMYSESFAGANRGAFSYYLFGEITSLLLGIAFATGAWNL